jgi:tetratricopeptide (TPR) repeat protein
VKHRPTARVQALFAAAVSHHQGGRLAGAERAYRQVIALSPDLAAAHANLGSVLRQSDQPAAAVACFRRCLRLRPDDANAHTALGHVLNDLGQFDEAAVCYEAALRLRPDSHDALVGRAALFVRQGRLDTAEDGFRRALVLCPGTPAVLVALGGVLHRLGRTDAAVDCYADAAGLAPDDAGGRNDLGVALDGQDRPEEALACFRSAIRLRPDLVAAHNNLAAGLQKLGYLDEAEAGFRRALALAPEDSHALNNLGSLLREQQRLDAAVAAYRQAIASRPDYANAHNNLAMALLAQGEMTEGWREYEWRWQTPHLASGCRVFAEPLWRGQAAPAGTRLLLHAEQGLGDTIQFCRYATLAVSRGFRVTLQVPRPLVRLSLTLDGIDQVIAEDEAPASFDLHCPLLSLPLALGTTLATIPAAPAYLRADAALAEAWRVRLAGVPEIRVGLVWAGKPRRDVASSLIAIDRRRSLPPALLAPLLALPGVRFFSLQAGGPAAPDAFALTDFMPEMTDFADTAALIANLDLVISVDTAAAHLAAALGKPVWLLDRFDPCWRWLIGRRDSPWYPSLRIYRQPAPGDWDSVLAEVAADLAALRDAPRRLRPGAP